MWRNLYDRKPLYEDGYDPDLQILILQDMLQGLPDVFDKSMGSFAFDMLSPASIKIAQMYKQNEIVRNKLYIKNLKGEELEKRIKELAPIDRKVATKATGYVIFKGDKNITIPKGSLVASDKTRFITLNEVTLDEMGSGQVDVECEEYGSIGNVGPKMIRYFPVTIPGVSTVYNPEAFTDGYDEETDESLYNRYIEYLRTPATSGNKYHYLQWAKEVEGVGGAKVLDAEKVGAGNVHVIIIDRNQNIADDELIETTYNYIEKQRPVGANVTVLTGEPKPIIIKADVVTMEDYGIKEIIEKFEVVLEEYRKEIVFKHDYISHSKIIQLLLSIDGVLDVRNLKLNNKNENLILGEFDIPIFSKVELTPIL